MKKVFLYPVIIFGISVILRFSNLGDFRCLNWDEASFGYNAYSILQTGKDEYGQTMPLEFKSVGDYKYPVYVYAMVPLVKLFGLTELTVRFLPAIAGSLAPIVLFAIAKTIFSNRLIAFLGALALALSPWHIQFTRAGTEGGIAYTLTLAGIYFLLQAIISKSRGFVLPAFLFFLSMFTYFGERVFIPLIIVAMALVFYKEIVSKGKKLIKPAILSAFLIIPLLLSVTSAGQGEKLSKTTIFGYTRPDEYEQTLVSTGDTPKLLAFFHSPILENGLSFLNHYLNHFSPDFLFVNGPINDGRQYVYGMGMLYLTDILFLVSGLHFLGKAGVSPKYKKLLLLWLLLSPIPSAITRDQVHARRALELTAPLSIIIGAGMFYVLLYINRLKNGWIKIPILCCLVLSFAYCVIFYLTSYYIFTPNRTAVGPSGWQCGYKEIVAATQKYKNVYSKIVVDTSYQGPYIFYLFYEKYSPAKYQTQAVLVNNKSDTLGEGGGYANYEFRSIYWPEDRLTKNTLFIGPPERLPEKDISDKEAKLLEKVYFHENKYLFHIVETF